MLNMDDIFEEEQPSPGDEQVVKEAIEAEETSQTEMAIEAKEGAEEAEEPIEPIDGVLTSVKPSVLAGRDAVTGRFGMANRIGAMGKRGRTRKAQVLDMIEAMIDPMEVAEALRGLITDRTSWRARDAGVRTYLEYMIGMPVQRSVTATTKLESILSQVGGMSDEEFDQVEQAMREA